MEEPNKKTERSRKFRNGMTPPEIILWKAISRKRLGYTVNRQKPFGFYFLDFYIAALKVAIEVDGRIHEDTFEHDDKRDKWLASQGVTVIRVSARSIFENIGDVVEFLQIRIDQIAAESKNDPPQD